MNIYKKLPEIVTLN